MDASERRLEGGDNASLLSASSGGCLSGHQAHIHKISVRAYYKRDMLRPADAPSRSGSFSEQQQQQQPKAEIGREEVTDAHTQPRPHVLPGETSVGQGGGAGLSAEAFGSSSDVADLELVLDGGELQSGSMRVDSDMPEQQQQQKQQQGAGEALCVQGGGVADNQDAPWERDSAGESMLALHAIAIAPPELATPHGGTPASEPDLEHMHTRAAAGGGVQVLGEAARGGDTRPAGGGAEGAASVDEQIERYVLSLTAGQLWAPQGVAPLEWAMEAPKKAAAAAPGLVVTGSFSKSFRRKATVHGSASSNDVGAAICFCK